MTRSKLAVLCLSCILWAAPSENSWQPIGPFGGDARSLAADPHDFSRLFAGTSNSQIYFSSDGGHHWQRLSELAPRHDLVIGRLFVDPTDSNTLYAGAYTTGNGEGGGVFVSTSAGASWKEMPDMGGQSVRALVMAPGDPRMLVAGTLEGVFRSTDAGDHWKRISPEFHQEIRNIESLSVDPLDHNAIYAGTWHLPWKTNDGGATWFSIKDGLIDDSDVFTITVDWSNRETAYLGACSGIYRTDNAGMTWRKIQGIPFSARRTRAIRQDPQLARTVYAGTTEGLWKTENGGTNWSRMTSPTLIVNDVAIDPRNSAHVILATDRAGMLESHDGARSFSPANQGFSHRQVWRLVGGSQEIAAAVRHDKEFGGVFLSSDGENWRAAPEGLDDNDVLSLTRLPSGELLAGTGGGLYRYTKGAWTPTGKLLRPVKLASGRSGMTSFPLIHEIVDLATTGGVVYAATADGVLRSNDGGATWLSLSPGMLPKWNVTHVAASPDVVVAATENGLRISRNSGVTWGPNTSPSTLPEPSAINALAAVDAMVYVASDHGLFRSTDAGASWERHGRGVPTGPVYDIAVDPADAKRIYVGSTLTNRVYVSRDGGASYDPLEQTGFVGRRPRRLAFGPGGRLYLATGYDGLFSRMP
jgi:photosystem II stability/assembly factor-like uncharacterized protein